MIGATSKPPKVSIVTAVRNGAPEIGYTLASVQQQTYKDIEHIIIDGASTDDTLAIAKTSSSSATRIFSEPDEGVYDAFNKGLRRCSGDIIAYLNAGDEYSNPGVVQTVVDEFYSSGADAVFGDLVIIDALDRTRVVRRYRSSQFRPSRARFGFMPAHPTLFIRRGVYEKYGGYDASYEIAGDFELTTRLFVREKIRYSCLQQILVRMAHGGLSTKGLRSNWIITREMRRACASNSVRTGWLRLLLRFPIKLFELQFRPA